MKKKILALLLAAAMLLSLFGCTKEPEPTEPATEPATEPTEPAPDALQVYADACALLSGQSALTWDVTTEKTVQLKEQSFQVTATKVYTSAGAGTDDAVVRMEENVTVTDTDDAGKEIEKEALYVEVYAGGTLYASLADQGKVSGPMSQEEFALRCVPAVLLDSALYGDIALETAGDEITLTFTGPTAAESWAMPAEATLQEATGTAVLKAGAVQSMRYTVTYLYGSATVTETTQVTVRQETLEAAVPEDADTYTAVQYPSAMRLIKSAKDLREQSESVSFSSMDSAFSQAGGVIRNLGTYVDVYDTGEELAAKIKNNYYAKDYSTGEDYQFTQEEIYQNGKYTYVVDDNVPTSQTGVDDATIRDYCEMMLLAYVPQAQYWQDVTCEDLGSLYYLEFTYNEDFGSSIQNMVCMDLYEDPGLLNNLASAYTTDEITGYAAIDKYTGQFTACGYKYQGTHTIDGDPYVLTSQMDQAYTLPSFGAYKEITDELLPESEPEQKATPLFYHVTGPDGQQMWLFGTIHIGDERTGYLPQEIYDAFAASDALALECDTEAFDKQVEEDEKLQEQVSDLYYYSDGTTVADHVDEEIYKTALKYLKATGNYNMNADYMKASVWSNSIDNFYLDQGHNLSREQGVEERLTKLAHEQDKEIREVESSLFQIKMLNGWSEELQEQLLKEAVEYPAIDSINGTNELYEMWCEGDEATLREYLAEEVDTSEMTEEELAEYEAMKPLMEEYNQSMSIDRNEGMLKKAIEYLESGDVVFYAVGLAHLLDSTNGLVDTLREAGYTVELVTYQ